ncbi:DUF1631 domain-containing protein [Pseudoxanthomonas sacheonensis]|uniref:DUF1631 domain-containing protein n=1 Tax=Pseudoxanthomonas sacheonensis TaxID=443615 RepID=UPI0013D1F5AA|nr:DUF1631 domain-containing protein [Pseudoxanthomonas sacheonensis]KAF1712755.1 thymidine phosphorylase [Pseudoxanthomonas sacheonensis]
MSSVPPVLPSSTPATIAQALSLPPRVRKILGVFFGRVSLDLSERIGQMLVESEQQLFKLAERARSNEKQAEQFANLHGLRKSRADLLPMFLAGLEGEFAAIRLPRAAPAKDAHERIEYQTMTLVEDAEMDQDIVLREIARRHDARARTPLYLMGQRFGVLAGSPAFDAAQLPVGPQTLCKVLRASVAAAFKIDLDSQLLLYKAFDQKALADYAGWMEILNTLLAQQGVLPGLVYAPQRARSDEGSRRPGIGGPHPSEGAPRPMTDWYGHSSPSAWSAFGQQAMASAVAAPVSGHADAAQAIAGIGKAGAEQAGSDASSFATLQQLLQGRRAAMSPGSTGPASTGPAGQAGARPSGAAVASFATGTHATGTPLPTHDVLSTLRSLQAAAVPVNPGQPRRTMQDVQKAMLEQVREQHGPQAALVQQDADTFELLGLLYNEIEREVQRDAPAADLLVRLQVPVAQAALHDREFFLRPQHPARELLNSVAESGAAWLGEDEADPQLLQKLHHAVERVVTDYNGDDEVFESVNNDVQAHFRAMARKAEVTERRHVEAARGKDRLEIAKQRAAETIDTALQGHVPPKFVQALLNQAWADVLTLTQLRNGQDSEEWREQVELTQRIATVTGGDSEAEGATLSDGELTPKIEAALSQVGYHPDEAAAIARRLSSAEDDETTSRTELTARLKARARLGEQVEIPKKKHIERTPREQECHDYLRTLPFGTWFEFVKNQQGDVTRQRLSWYSPVTDHALFVNQRGQRIGEQSMDSLARLMALEQVHVVTQDKGRLIDRAWRATISALRSFTSAPAAGQGANA